VSDRLKKIFDSDEHDLLKVTPRSKSVTPDDRLAKSFLEINDFFAEHGHIPAVNTPDISERKLGVRLRAIMLDDSKVETLAHLDQNNLLKPEAPPENINDIFKDDEFGLLDDPTGILTINNVPRNIKKADSISRAKKSNDFEKFEQGFKDIHTGLSSGLWQRTSINSEYQIQSSRYFVFNGVLAYVNNRDDSYRVNGKINARLHVIYENGTESNILLRSFARTLYRAKEGARIVPANFQSNPEWSDIDGDDQTAGYIYVLSSLSDEPRVQDMMNLYKIGFTTGSVEERIRGAKADPTYLMAPVKIEATYKCFNMNTQKFEHLLHRFFSEVKLDLGITGSNGLGHKPSEWYVVPLEVIDRVANLIVNGEIVNYRYDSGLKDIVSIDS
jgi:hypothetical protein